MASDAKYNSFQMAQFSTIVSGDEKQFAMV